MSSPYQPRRKSLFAPFDPNDPDQAAQDQGGYPNLGPVGAMGVPPQQSMSAPAPQEQPPPQMFTPPQMPSMSAPTKDTTQSAPQGQRFDIPRIGAEEQAAPPQPAPGIAERRKNLAGDPLPEMPEPPVRKEYPPYNPFSLGHANAAARAAIDKENDFNEKVYAARMKAYETMTNARALGAYGPAEGQITAALLNAKTPEERQQLMDLLEKSHRFNQPQTKPDSEFQYWQQQNPGKPLSDFYKIKPAVQGAQIHVDNPREPNPTSTPLTIDTTDGPVQGSFKGGQYFDGAGRPIPPEKMRGASRLGSGGSPADIETLAQSLAAGDLTRIKDVTSMRNDTRTRLYARIKQINPNYNTADVDRKIKMLDNFNNGKDGQQVQSFGTFLEHSGDAADAIKNISLSNTPALNRPLNWWRQNMSGDPNYQRLLAALEPVRKEYEGFLLGGRALYGDDRKKAEVLLSDNSSPAQMMAALKQMGNVANDRFNESNFRYKRVIGKDIENPFSEEAIAGAAKIGVKVGAHKASAATASQTLTNFHVNPTTGERIGYDAEKKQWVPAPQ